MENNLDLNKVEKKILKIENLKKHFGNFKAVDDLSFDIKQGEFFAFLGPNGAGKSTTINCISTIINPTSGNVTINGHKLSDSKIQIRREIGLVFQENISDGSLTIEENLRIHCELYDVPKDLINDRIDTALDVVQLLKEKKKRVGALSGGMKRRVEVAKAILHEPTLLLLDEPTAGLDPQTRINMWNFLMELKDKTGMTILLTTHHMDEAEQCDRIAIIDHGKLLALGSPTELSEKHTTASVSLKTNEVEKLTEFVKEKGTIERQGNEFKIHLDGSMTEFIIELSKSNIKFSDISTHRPKLTDVFINLTGREYRD